MADPKEVQRILDEEPAPMVGAPMAAPAAPAVDLSALGIAPAPPADPLAALPEPKHAPNPYTAPLPDDPSAELDKLHAEAAGGIIPREGYGVTGGQLPPTIAARGALEDALTRPGATAEEIAAARSGYTAAKGEARKAVAETGVRDVRDLERQIGTGKIVPPPSATGPGAPALSGLGGALVAGGINAGVQPRPNPYGGGVATAPVQDPFALRFGLSVGDQAPTPADYADRLKGLVLTGRMSPDEARKRAADYAAGYDSLEGRQFRLQSSDAEQQQWQANVAMAQQRTDIATAQQTADIKAQAAQARLDLAAQEKAAQDAYSAAMADSQRNLAQAMQRAEEFKIDPSKTWSGATGGAAAAFSALGFALGGIAQALTRGQQPNALPPIIDRLVEREADAQKTQLSGLRSGIADRQTLMGLMRQHFADDAQARAATKAALLQSLADQADKIADDATNAKAERAARLGSDLLRRKVDDQRLAFETALQAQLAQAKQIAAAQAAAGQAVAQQQSAQQALRPDSVRLMKPKEFADAYGLTDAVYIPSEGAFATGPKENRKEAISAIAAGRNIIPALDDMANRLNAAGVLEGSKDIGAYDALRSKVLMIMPLALGKTEGGKALEDLEEAIPTASRFSALGRDKQIAAVDALRKSMTHADSVARDVAGLQKVVVRDTAEGRMFGMPPGSVSPPSSVVTVEERGPDGKPRKVAYDTAPKVGADTRPVDAVAGAGRPVIPDRTTASGYVVRGE